MQSHNLLQKRYATGKCTKYCLTAELHRDSQERKERDGRKETKRDGWGLAIPCLYYFIILYCVKILNHSSIPNWFVAPKIHLFRFQQGLASPGPIWEAHDTLQTTRSQSVGEEYVVIPICYPTRRLRSHSLCIRGLVLWTPLFCVIITFIKKSYPIHFICRKEHTYKHD